MQLKEIMTREVNRIQPDASLADAIEKLKQLDGEPLPVYEGDRLVGMLTEHDIVEWTSRGGRDSRLVRVRDVMGRDIPYCYEDQDVEDATRLVRERHAQGVVVLKRDGGRTQNQIPVGTVSLADLAVKRLQTERPTEQRIEQRVEGIGEVPQTRVNLQPIAAPSILGLFSLAGATFMVGAFWANWFTGNAAYLFPFVGLLGGVAQFLAAMWAYKARDGVATAMHGTWGTFFAAFALLQWLFAAGTLTQPSPTFAEFGLWFIVLGAITFMSMIGAFRQNLFSGLTLAALTVASALAAYGYISGNGTIIPYAGYFLIISALLALYTASALLYEGIYRQSILPLGRTQTPGNVPGDVQITRHGYDFREPGVKMGQ